MFFPAQKDIKWKIPSKKDCLNIPYIIQNCHFLHEEDSSCGHNSRDFAGFCGYFKQLNLCDCLLWHKEVQIVFAKPLIPFICLFVLLFISCTILYMLYVCILRVFSMFCSMFYSVIKYSFTVCFSVFLPL